MVQLQTNQRYNNSTQIGNTVEWFEQAKQIIHANDGKRRCDMIVSYCHDQQAQFDFADHTQIEITTKSVDVSNIRKGFITANCEYQIQISGLDTTTTDADRLGKLFIGYKASCQSVRRMQLYHNGTATSYLNEYMIQEGVAFAVPRPLTAKDKKKFLYTLYENARMYKNEICGTFIDLTDFKDGAEHSVSFEFNIPVVDFLALQCFNKWLKEFGKLTLELYLATHSLVVCSVDPKAVLENKLSKQTDNVGYGVLAGDLYKFEHRFTQIGDKFMGFQKIANSGTAPNGTTTFTTGYIRVHCNSAKCKSMTSTIRGYDITDNARRTILQSLEPDGLVIPAQQLIWKAFPTPPTEQGVETTLDIPYDNITACVVVFPKTSNQITCFENPMLDGLYLKVENRMIPNQPYNSTGARFLQEELIINDLDGNLQATQEFTSSIINERNKPDGTRYLNALEDDTSFMATFELERGDSSYVYDGYTSNGSVNTLIKGDARYKGVNNTYLYPLMSDADPEIVLIQPNTIAPQLWLCHDVWFRVKTNAFEYLSKGSPPNSQST